MGEKRSEIEERNQRALRLAYSAGRLNGAAETNRKWIDAAEASLPPALLERLCLKVLGPEPWEKKHN